MSQRSRWLPFVVISVLLAGLLSGCSHRITVALVRTLKDSEVLSLAFSPDGSLLASASADGTVKLWRVADGSEVHTIQGHQGSVFLVAFSSDSKLVISGSHDRTIKGWHVDDGSTAWVFTYAGDAKALWVTPERTILAITESSAGIAKLWDIPKGTEIHTLKDPCWGGNSYVAPLALAGEWIAGSVTTHSMPFATCIALWKPTEDIHKRLPFPTSQSRFAWIESFGIFEIIDSLVFSPNGRFLAAKLPYRIILWEIENGIIKNWPRVLHLTEDKPWVRDRAQNLTFSPDGTLLAWCDSEGHVRIWKVPGGQEVGDFIAEGCPVIFSSDGQLLASGSVSQESSEATIKIWKLHRP